MFTEPWLAGGGYCLIQSEPSGCFVFVCLMVQRFIRIGFQQICNVQVQMGRHPGTFFDMPVDGQYFQGEYVFTEGAYTADAAFFLYLTYSHGQQVFVSVRMSAQPGLGIVDVVVCHQDLCPGGISDPGGGGQMGYGIVSGKNVRTAAAQAQDLCSVFFFLFVEGYVFFNLFCQFHGHMIAEKWAGEAEGMLL